MFQKSIIAIIKSDKGKHNELKKFFEELSNKIKNRDSDTISRMEKVGLLPEVAAKVNEVVGFECTLNDIRSVRIHFKFSPIKLYKSTMPIPQKPIIRNNGKAWLKPEEEKALFNGDKDSFQTYCKSYTGKLGGEWDAQKACIDYLKKRLKNNEDKFRALSEAFPSMSQRKQTLYIKRLFLRAEFNWHTVRRENPELPDAKQMYRKKTRKEQAELKQPKPVLSIEEAPRKRINVRWLTLNERRDLADKLLDEFNLEKRNGKLDLRKEPSTTDFQDFVKFLEERYENFFAGATQASRMDYAKRSFKNRRTLLNLGQNKDIAHR